MRYQRKGPNRHESKPGCFTSARTAEPYDGRCGPHVVNTDHDTPLNVKLFRSLGNALPGDTALTCCVSSSAIFLAPFHSLPRRRHQIRGREEWEHSAALLHQPSALRPLLPADLFLLVLLGFDSFYQLTLPPGLLALLKFPRIEVSFCKAPSKCSAQF